MAKIRNSQHDTENWFLYLTQIWHWKLVFSHKNEIAARLKKIKNGQNDIKNCFFYRITLIVAALNKTTNGSHGTENWLLYGKNVIAPGLPK